MRNKFRVTGVRNRRIKCLTLRILYPTVLVQRNFATPAPPEFTKLGETDRSVYTQGRPCV